MFNCCGQKAICSATLKLGNLSEVDNTCYNFKFPLEKRPLDKMFLLDKFVSRQNTSPFEIKKTYNKEKFDPYYNKEGGVVLSTRESSTRV